MHAIRIRKLIEKRTLLHKLNFAAGNVAEDEYSAKKRGDFIGRLFFLVIFMTVRQNPRKNIDGSQRARSGYDSTKANTTI